MTSHEFRQLRAQAGLSVRHAAEALGIAPSSVWRYEHDDRAIPSDVADTLRRLALESTDERRIPYAMGQAHGLIESVRDDTSTDALVTPNAQQQLSVLLVRFARALNEMLTTKERRLIEGEFTDLMTAVPVEALDAETGPWSAEAESNFWLGYYQGRHDRRRRGEDEPAPDTSQV